MKLNPSSLDRGKANLNFELSHFKFAFGVQKISRKYENIFFKKTSFLKKKGESNLSTLQFPNIRNFHYKMKKQTLQSNKNKR